MASEQMVRRENNETIVEREVHIEKHRSKEKEEAEKAAGENLALGAHLEPLAADKIVRDEIRERELHADRARSANIARAKEAEEEAKRKREGGGYVGKFEMKGTTEGKGSGEKDKGLKGRVETERNREEKERRGGQVEAEQKAARTMEGSREAQARQRGETQAPTKQLGGSEGRERKREEDERSRLEEISKCRAQAQQNAMDAIASAQERYEREKQAASEAGDIAKKHTANKKEEAERESEAKREVQNQESKERPSAKTTTTHESFERDQDLEQEGKVLVLLEQEGKVLGLAPQRAPANPHESNTVESYQGGSVQERNQGGFFGETNTNSSQHAQAQGMNTAESLQSQEGKASNINVFTEVYTTSGGDTVNDAARRRVQEEEPYENIAAGKLEQCQGRGNREGGGGVVQMVKKPLESATEGGREVLGAVGETVAEIGGNMMKPGEKVQQGKGGGGVLGAIGETIAEIAQTTKVIAVGEGETTTDQSRQNKQKNIGGSHQ